MRISYIQPTPPPAGSAPKDTCTVTAHGVRYCVRSIAPNPAPTLVFVQKFSRIGVKLGAPVPVTMPFSRLAPAGANALEWVQGSSLDTITTVAGRPRVVFLAGNESISSGGGIGRNALLNVFVSDPLPY